MQSLKWTFSNFRIMLILVCCFFTGITNIYAHKSAGFLLPVSQWLWSFHLLLEERGIRSFQILSGKMWEIRMAPDKGDVCALTKPPSRLILQTANCWYFFFFFYSFFFFVFFFSENRIWYFMQIVSIRDSLHEMSKPVFWQK